ncbi:hypothetical protein GJAV_G00125430 [Gymnothorax javanicus]|nr:hypothetical protein GJAV_G00125430 [Gymnothorax javanicus]
MSAASYSDSNGVRLRKRKARFSFSEVHMLLDEVKKNRHIVVGKFNRGVPTGVKKRTWEAITACVNEIGECQREVIEVVKKWCDLKCDTKRKVAAIRAGAVPYKGINSYHARELSPIENIVHQILELDGKRGKLPTTVDGVIYSGSGVGEEEEGEEEEEEYDMLLSVPSSSLDGSNNGDIDPSTVRLPPHPRNDVKTPVSSGRKETRSPLYASRYRDSSHPSFEVQYEIVADDQELRLVDSDEEGQGKVLPLPNPTENEHPPASLGHVTTSVTTSRPTPSSPVTLSQLAPGAPDRIADMTSLSLEQQHETNVLLETVSRSLELLAESVQQLAETQKEFVQDSLRLQRETVYILRDFASGALAIMHDKLNGQPTL